MTTSIIQDNKNLTIYQRLMAAKRTDLTRQAYTYDLASFAEFMGLDHLDQITDEQWEILDPAYIAAYIEWLKSLVSDHTDRPYSTSTIARKITALKEFLIEANYQGLYPIDKLRYIKERLETPEITSDHHAGITPDEQDRLLRAASEQPGLKGQRDYLIFRLFLETGIRRAELTTLKVRSLVTLEGIPALLVRGKGDRNREIGIEGDTNALLKTWLSDSGQGDDPNRPIFPQVRKFGRGEEAKYQVVNPEKHLNPRALNHLVRRYVIMAGIESKVTPHSFRVAMVTDSLEGGAPIQHVQKATGHTTTRMITDIYDRNQYREPVSKFRKRKLYSPK